MRPSDFDAIIIGAGVSGLYQLYKLRELGLRTRVFEDRHQCRRHLVLEPLSRRALRLRKLYLRLFLFAGIAARNGTGRSTLPAQPETERYLNYVADKFDLRRDIQFNSRVTAAHYQEADAQLGCHAGGRQALPHALPDHRHRRALGADHAAHPGRRHVQGPVLPHRTTGRRNRSTSPASGSR